MELRTIRRRGEFGEEYYDSKIACSIGSPNASQEVEKEMLGRDIVRSEEGQQP